MITYIEYLAGNKKGTTEAGHLFNSPFKLGDVDGTFTGEAVTETFVAAQTTLAWTPVVKGAFVKADGTVLGDVKVTSGSTVVYGTFAEGSEKTGTLASMTFVDEDGTSTTHTFAAGDKIAYRYELSYPNVIILINS